MKFSFTFRHFSCMQSSKVCKFCFLFLLQAIIALTFAKYVASPFFPDCPPSDNAVRLLAAACLCKF